MSGWDNVDGKNTRTPGARVVENAKLRHPGHDLGRDHVLVQHHNVRSPPGEIPGSPCLLRGRWRLP
eukprot:160383-Prymnesium_polylepis.1